MGIFDLLKLPVTKVVADKTGAFGGLFQNKPVKVPTNEKPVEMSKAGPVKITPAPQKPLRSLIAEPIGKITPIQKATGGPQKGVLPQVDTTSPLGFLRAPISSVAPRPEVKVRKQEWKDVANMPSEIGGFVVGPLIDAVLSIREAVTGKRGKVEIKNPFPNQGAIPADEPVPQWFKEKLEKEQKQSLHPQIVEGAWESHKEEHNKSLKTGYSSETSQQFYVDQLDAGVDPKQAFWNTALKTVMDISILVPVARDVGKLTLLKTAPEKLVESRVVKATRQEIRDFASGADKYRAAESPLPKEIQDAFKAASAEEKIAIIRGSGIEVATAKPSALGRLFGVSQEEADALLKQMFGGKSVREGSAGQLPGYVRDEPVPAFGLSTERRKAVGFGDNGRVPKRTIKVDEETRAYDRKAFDSFLDDIKGDTIPMTHETSIETVKKILAGGAIGNGDDVFASIGHLENPDFVPEGARILFEVPKSEVEFAPKDQEMLGGKYAIGLDTMDHPSIGDFNGVGGHVAAPLKNEWIVDIVDKNGKSLMKRIEAQKKVAQGKNTGPVEIQGPGTYDVVRQHTEQTAVTDTFRGGTWYQTHIKNFNFDPNDKKGLSPNVGGTLKTNTKVELKNPFIIDDASLDDGSFAVYNEGYENVFPKQQKEAIKILTDARFGETDASLVAYRKAITKALTKNGNTPAEIKLVIRSKNMWDAAMDLIVSKGLRAQGYDGLVLKNVYKGNLEDQHVFRFASADSPTPLKGSKKSQKSEVAERGGEKELTEAYKKSGPSSLEGFTMAEEKLSNILTEMELSMPRETVFIGYGKDARVDMIPSTFPNWVPEGLRLRKLFEKVIPDLDNIKYPKGSRQRALYDAIFDELDARLGMDTREIRNKIKTNENQVQKADAKADGGSALRSDEGRNKTEAKKEESLETREVNIEDILPWEEFTARSPKKIEKFKEQIKQGKELDPILLYPRKDGAFDVYDGHHRLQAMKEMGMTKIPSTLIDPNKGTLLGIDGSGKPIYLEAEAGTAAKEKVNPYDRPPFGPGSEEDELVRKGGKFSEEGIRMSTKDVEARINKRKAKLDQRMKKDYDADPKAVKEGEQTLKQLRETRRYQELRDKEDFGNGEEKALSKKELAKLWQGMSVEDAVRSVIPPVMKNGVAIPAMDDFFKWRDKSPLLLARETLERNIEKVVGEADRAKVKEFFLEPIRKNETERIKFANALRKETEEKIIKRLGIRRKTGTERLGQRAGLVRKNIKTELVQRYGEGNQGEFPITLEELKRIEPNNWMAIKEAAEYFRGKYNMLLEMVNKQRVAYGYEIIPARPDYFRHFREIDSYITRFGMILKSEDLPGSMTGLTGIFKPGKPFSTAEIKRKGKKTEIDAVAGFDNYINSITRQIFHIDSVQRGRALEKYMREAMEASEHAAKVDSEKLILGNFANSIKETTNLVSGKKSDFDRAVESRVGRKIYAAADWLKQRTSANMVGANVASALTNYAPLTQALATTEKKHALRGLGEAMMLPAKREPFKIDGVESGFLTRRYPIEMIDPRGLQKASQKAAWIFRGVDQFSSTLIVSGKYYENIAHGMTKEAAMRDADAYASKMIADRSVGQVPLLISDKGLGFITQFQLEVNNTWSFAINDIPNMSGKNKLKYGSMLSQFLIYSYLFNSLYERITGRRPILDPIYMVLTLVGATPEADNSSMPRRIVLAGKDLAGNVPFIGGFTGGRFPAFSVIPNPVGPLTGDSEWSKELLKIPMIVLPFGGLQAKKTYTGIESLIRGYTEDTKGQRKAEVDATPGNVIRGTIFGPGGLKESKDSNPVVSDLYSRLDSQRRGTSELTARAEALDTQLRAMSPEEADAKATEIAEKDPALFERLEKVVRERQLGLTQEERLIKQLGVKNGERARYVDEVMMRLPDGEARDAYLNELIEKKVVTDPVLEQLQEFVANGESAPAVPDGTKLKEDSVINRALTYAKAIGSDPVTAFNRIFTGQKIRYVKNGTVVVERMNVGASQAEASEQLLATTTPGLTRDAVKLDHTIPLQLGGSNDKENLRLILTSEWENFTPVENFLGEALRDKKISRREAQKLITRFKAGDITAEEVYKSVGQ